MTWLETQTFFVGKLFLIGLTFLNGEDAIIEEWETSGTVEELTDDGLLRFRRLDGSLFKLPFEPEAIHTADKGEYKEKETGNIVVDPDFITTWKIRVKDNDNLDEVKREGYIE